MATTFRNFQNEIEQIHHRELAKQRVHGAEQLQKEQKLHSHAKGKAKEDTVVELASAGTEEIRDTVEAEEKILVCSIRSNQSMNLMSISYRNICRRKYQLIMTLPATCLQR